MKYRFPYSYYDLGELQEGDTVVVGLSGQPANVLLLDRPNLERYRFGFRFSYVGRLYRRSPVELSVPHDGHWYVAMDLGGRPGHTRGAVKVVASDGSRRELDREARLTESTA
jgi:hypothetical protein